MKTTAVVESLSYYKTNVLFQRIPTYYKNKILALISTIPGDFVGFVFNKVLIVPDLEILLQYLHECSLLHPPDLGWVDCGSLVLTNMFLREGVFLCEIIKFSSKFLVTLALPRFGNILK